MLKKILLGFKIILPIVVNILLFSVIYQSIRSEHILTDTLFYLGIINLIYGLGSLFIISRSSGGLYIQRDRARVINLALAHQNIKDYHKGNMKSYNGLSLLSKYLRLIHIVLGILLCISAIIVYSI